MSTQNSETKPATFSPGTSTGRLREALRGLANENLALRKYINLVSENCDLHTAQVLATVMSRCDDRLKNCLLGHTDITSQPAPRAKSYDSLAPGTRGPKSRSLWDPSTASKKFEFASSHASRQSSNSPDVMSGLPNTDIIDNLSYLNTDASNLFNVTQRSNLQSNPASEWSSSFQRPQSAPPVSPSYRSTFNPISIKDLNESDPGVYSDPTRRQRLPRPQGISEINQADLIRESVASYPKFMQGLSALSMRDIKTSQQERQLDTFDKSSSFGRNGKTGNRPADEYMQDQLTQSYDAAFILMKDLNTSDSGMNTVPTSQANLSRSIEQSDKQNGMHQVEKPSHFDQSPSYGQRFDTLGTNELIESGKSTSSFTSPRKVEAVDQAATKGQQELGKTFICDGCQTQSPRSVERAEKKQVSFEDGQYELSFPEDPFDDGPDFVFGLFEKTNEKDIVNKTEPILAGSMKGSLDTTYNTVDTHQSPMQTTELKSFDDDILNVQPNAHILSKVKQIVDDSQHVHRTEPRTEGRPAIIATDKYPEVAHDLSHLPEGAMQRLMARREIENVVGVTKQMIGSPQASSTPLVSPRYNRAREYLENLSPVTPSTSACDSNKYGPSHSGQILRQEIHKSTKGSIRSPGATAHKSPNSSGVQSAGLTDHHSTRGSSLKRSSQPRQNSTRGIDNRSPGRSSHNSTRGSCTQSTCQSGRKSNGDSDAKLSSHKDQSSTRGINNQTLTEPSDDQLASVLGLKGKGATEKAHHVFYRAVDILTNYHPTLTDELSGSASRARPSRRIVGEIAFQLDRRILDHVFELACLGKTKRKSRYYGYSVANIDLLIIKESRQFGEGQENVKDYLNTKLDALLLQLAKCSYDIDRHGKFTQETVNKYGLLNGIPADLEASHVERAWLDDAGALRLLIGQLLSEGEELPDMLIILDCLCLMAYEDKKPLLIL